MSLPAEVVQKIQDFAKSCNEFETQREQEFTGASHSGNYGKELDATLKSLQEQAERQESTLNRLRARSPLDLPRPDLDPATRLAQTRRAAAAYRSLTAKQPELPAPGSPLSGLLVFRDSIRLIRELKASISAVTQDLVANRERLNTEEANLRDARMITAELRRRLEAVQTQQQQEARKKKKPSQLAKELIQKERNRETELDRRTAELKVALKSFVDEHLASMLAAEDLGGPVVGDQVDISDSTLEAGYTAHGKEKKPKTKHVDDADSRQQRIDDLVRRRASGVEGPASTVNNRRDASAAEFHALIDRLLDAASTSSYIELEKDSAVSRFLVKAKVAQFHPRDSRKLRLVDVARDISD
ncbi:uncharacterized protein CIMG_01063 [Coccidioides immitis RS]|uniref:Uncharacterized protein n=2 Tax=Coccidioides immitis TaxID=5501 RepID=J3KIC4_COCIM|nr:uncharacterized protein CIMG_01063 [Coccidioides immitis RS]EAS35709.3 hypothetical protein CIMG_01063 [Coccidioides immitis RS]KMP00988.1 hypothetical protein CIRG_01128 [Coccidioides immitis RMSCC 2394]TPX26069.1 hypothetical protein DIZ76_011528 [Coccidioides immitis]